eukprot:TRINITY_DN9440_c0_g1_i1.p1 TRINITY_DN9440_c0_g1~~TRINITY_DN9440_c0_g1_i1.p1  ORF type:complete len:253 (-),score=72.12 TRINITY_DN9440_c0_g1_i1:14-772(-)
MFQQQDDAAPLLTVSNKQFSRSNTEGSLKARLLAVSAKKEPVATPAVASSLPPTTPSIQSPKIFRRVTSSSSISENEGNTTALLQSPALGRKTKPDSFVSASTNQLSELTTSLSPRARHNQQMLISALADLDVSSEDLTSTSAKSSRGTSPRADQKEERDAKLKRADSGSSEERGALFRKERKATQRPIPLEEGLPAGRNSVFTFSPKIPRFGEGIEVKSVEIHRRTEPWEGMKKSPRPKEEKKDEKKEEKK